MNKTPDKRRPLWLRLLRTAGIGVLLLFATAALGVTWLLLDTSRSKSLVEYIVTDLTGRELRIEGDFSLGIGEELRVAASDVRWANMEGGKAPYLLDVGRILVTVPVAGLLEGTVVISYAEANDAGIWLEWNDDGLLNWIFFPDSPPADEPAEPLPLQLQQASLSNVRLHVINPALTEELVVTIERADHQEDDQHRLVLDADLMLIDRPLKLQGPIGPFPELAVAGAVDFDLRLTGELANLVAAGSFDSLADLSDPDLQASFTATDAATVLERLRLPAAASGTIDLAASVVTDDVGIVATAGGNLGEFSLDSRLNIKDLTSLEGFELFVESAGPSVSDLLSLAGVEGFNDIPYQFSIDARETPDGLVLQKFLFETSITRVSASGSAGQLPDLRDLRLDLDARGENIGKVLSVLDIDINYAAPFEIKADIDSQGRGSDDKFIGSFVIGESRVDFDGKLTEAEELDGSELHLVFASPDIGRILSGLGVELGGEVPVNLDSRLALADDRLLVREVTGRVANTSLKTSGSVPLKAGGSPAELALELGGPDLRFALNRLMAGAGDFLPARPFSIATDVSLTGDVLKVRDARASTDDTVARLNGDIGFGGDDLTVSGRSSVSGDNLGELMQAAGIEGFAPAPFAVDYRIDINSREIVVRELDAQLPNGRVRGDITAFGEGYSDFRFDLRASGDNLDRALPELDPWAPENMPFDFTLRGIFADNIIDLDAADIRVGDARIRAESEIVLEPEFALNSLRIDANGPRLSDLGQIGDWDLKNKPFEIRARATRKGNRAEIRDFLIRAADNDLQGDLIIEEGETDSVSLQITSRKLDLDEIRTKVTTDPDEPSTYISEAPAPEGEKVFNDEPLPFDALYEINADVAADISNLVAESRVFSDVSVRATLQDGSLVLERGELGTSSGKLRLQGSVKPAADTWQIETDVSGDSLSIELEDMTAEEVAALPRFAIDSKLQLTGDTTKELAQSANGYFWALGGEGRIKRLQMGILTGDFVSELLTTLNPFAKQSEYSTLICHDYFFEIEKGVVRTGPAVIVRNDVITIVAQGNVDLVTEKLNLDFETTPNKGIGISVTDFVNPFIKVTGTLAQPRISLDAQGSAVKGGAAIMTAGMSIFAEGLWKRWVSSGKACEKITERAEKQRRDRDPRRRARPADDARGHLIINLSLGPLFAIMGTIRFIRKTP